ncbi:MAG TPA: MraY family glycosyltransferase [Puia sp.]|nr:MraY family glycosyltransferase [Puia sp.]
MSYSVILLMFPVTCALVCYSIRKIIYISEKKHLFDEPADHRKIHIARTPNLGGVGIFATMLVVSLLLFPSIHIEGFRYCCACAVLLFFLGLTDDLVGVNPLKKVGMQLIVALLITIPAGIRIDNFQGFLGWTEMAYPISIVFSVLFIILVINAFNLIDGINCLAGTVGLLSCCVFAFYFWRLHEDGYFFLSVSMSGCLAGFLIFNRTPARIFMGDTGSLFLGFIAAILSIRLIGSGTSLTRVSASSWRVGASALAIVPALLIIPIYDTLRIFFIRIMRGGSPFRADKNHIHHLLLELRLSHHQATLVLLAVNIMALVLVFVTSSFSLEFRLVNLLAFMLLMNGILLLLVYRQRSLPLKESAHYIVNTEELHLKGAQAANGPKEAMAI